LNDVWDISELARTNSTLVLIFDRYGKLLKQLNPNTESGWNGTLNGTALPSSDYWFRYVEEDTGRTVTGYFSLKR